MGIAGCSTREDAALSDGLAMAIKGLKEATEAESIETKLALNENDSAIPNSLEIIIKNSKRIKIDTSDIARYSGLILEYLFIDLNEKELPDLIKVTFYEGWDIALAHNINCESKTYNKEYIREYFHAVNSPEDKLTRLINNQLYQSAMTFCDSMIKLQPNEDVFYQYRAGIYQHLGDTIHKMEDLRRALFLNDSSSLNYCNLGVAVGEGGSPKKALQYLDTALALEPNSMRAIHFRAVFRLATGDTIGACNDYSSIKDKATGIHASLILACKSLSKK